MKRGNKEINVLVMDIINIVNLNVDGIEARLRVLSCFIHGVLQQSIVYLNNIYK
jgi:hypothetical protein